MSKKPPKVEKANTKPAKQTKFSTKNQKPKQSAPKKRTPKKQNKKSFFKSIFISVFIIALVVICALFYIKDESKTDTLVSTQTKTITDKNIKDKDIQKLKQDIQKQKQDKEDIFSKINANSSKTLADIKPPKKQFDEQQTQEVSVFDDESIKKPSKQTKFEEKITQEVSVFDDESLELTKNTKQTPKQTKFSKTKPYLTIIIDDVANSSHVNLIKSTNLPITPSIFPPSSYHPNTPKLAKEFDVFMVHLPMEAVSFNKEEKHTLRVGDSYNTILNTLNAIKKDFKGLRFYNNHTGSKFTSDYESMRKLLEISDNLGLVFLDSKTIASSKAKDIRMAQKKLYFVRDVFLDNQDNEEYVKSQLLKAIELAKQKGYAIAIGHPRINTINAIKNTDFSGVNIIKIDKMYDFLRHKK